MCRKNMGQWSAPEFDNDSGTDYNNCYQERKLEEYIRKDSQMSFVGITFLKGTIIGFGDSKSTLITRSKRYPDEEREPVKKVFKGKAFILVCWGANTFYEEKDGTVEEVWLENIVDPLLETSDDPVSLCEKLYRHLKTHVSPIFSGIYVLAGYLENNKKENQLMYMYSEIKKDYFKMERHPVDTPYICYDGEERYVEYFDRKQKQLYTGEPEQIQATIKKAIEDIGQSGKYNTVGEPVVIQKLQV